MASAKRMGAYNALDDLLPGGDWAPPRPPRRRPPGRPRAGNALDDLLPGPRGPGEPGRAASRRRGDAGRHLRAWNPLDDLPQPPPVAAPPPPPAGPLGPVAGPGPAPVRARVSLRLPADLVEAARDAVAHLAGTADGASLTALAERALRAELARLAAAHNRGRPFPPRGGG